MFVPVACVCDSVVCTIEHEFVLMLECVLCDGLRVCVLALEGIV